ncbi:MAG: tRNA (cytidine(56)-2'-O)-methyltransferase [Candidatus Aenigmarchaeota archaeon]|nr:tRNA (cytidine(56)-2'-O)-methyltransferase [Candidatus Aenigmarchaeota archaeon]
MISILRLGHRLKRDERLSTHVGLVARALGADEIIYSGERDEGILESIRKTTKNWGGSFKVRYEESWKAVIKKYKKKRFKIVHATMYGEPVKKVMPKIRKEKDILVLVGSSKVPGQIYMISDYNVAVTSQPHSEVAALAVFLHEYFKGKEKGFKKAKLKIIPQKKGKKVIEN